MALFAVTVNFARSMTFVRQASAGVSFGIAVVRVHLAPKAGFATRVSMNASGAPPLMAARVTMVFSAQLMIRVQRACVWEHLVIALA